MTEEIPARRLKAYAFSAKLIVQMLRDGRVFGCEEAYDRLTITDGFPEGAKIVSAEYDQLSRLFVVIVEHESFDRVSEAVPMIPERIRWSWNDLPQGVISMQAESGE